MARRTSLKCALTINSSAPVVSMLRYNQQQYFRLKNEILIIGISSLKIFGWKMKILTFKNFNHYRMNRSKYEQATGKCATVQYAF